MALLGAMSACGSDDEPKAASTTTATTPVATTPAPTSPTQPQGSDGVTITIGNWEQHAEDPAVLAYKQLIEGIGASGNAGKIVPALRDVASKKVLRLYAPGLQQQWDNDWRVDEQGDAKILSSRASGSTTRIVACLWAPTTDFKDKSGKLINNQKAEWHKQRATVSVAGGTAKVTTISQKGTCSGGEPA